MDLGDLEKLHAAVDWLLRQDSLSRAIEHLSVELSGSQEPFVWTTVALETIPVALPPSIKSCWVFLLKRDVPSGSHYHPNSVQHMVALKGQGRSHVGGIERTMIPFGNSGDSILISEFHETVLPQNMRWNRGRSRRTLVLAARESGFWNEESAADGRD